MGLPQPERPTELERWQSVSLEARCLQQTGLDSKARRVGRGAGLRHGQGEVVCHSLLSHPPPLSLSSRIVAPLMVCEGTNSRGATEPRDSTSPKIPSSEA